MPVPITAVRLIWINLAGADAPKNVDKVRKLSQDKMIQVNDQKFMLKE